MYRTFSFSFFNQKTSLILITNIISFKKPVKYSNTAPVWHLLQNFLFFLQLFKNTPQGKQKVTEPTYFAEVTKTQAIIILTLFLTSSYTASQLYHIFICLLNKCIYIDSYAKKIIISIY